MRISKTPDSNVDPGFYFDFLFSLEGWGGGGGILDFTKLAFPRVPRPGALGTLLLTSVLGAIFLVVNREQMTVCNSVSRCLFM